MLIAEARHERGSFVLDQGRESIPDAIAQAVDTGSTADEVKKCYLRVVRAVHPDKVISAPLEERLEAQRIFATLSEAYQHHVEALARSDSVWDGDKPLPTKSTHQASRNTTASASQPRRPSYAGGGRKV